MAKRSSPAGMCSTVKKPRASPLIRRAPRARALKPVSHRLKPGTGLPWMTAQPGGFEWFERDAKHARCRADLQSVLAVVLVLPCRYDGEAVLTNDDIGQNKIPPCIGGSVVVVVVVGGAQKYPCLCDGCMDGKDAAAYHGQALDGAQLDVRQRQFGGVGIVAAQHNPCIAVALQ